VFLIAVPVRRTRTGNYRGHQTMSPNDGAEPPFCISPAVARAKANFAIPTYGKEMGFTLPASAKSTRKAGTGGGLSPWLPAPDLAVNTTHRRTGNSSQLLNSYLSADYPPVFIYWTRWCPTGCRQGMFSRFGTYLRSCRNTSSWKYHVLIEGDDRGVHVSPLNSSLAVRAVPSSVPARRG
jgi:hypothetical protein